jgi:TLD
MNLAFISLLPLVATAYVVYSPTGRTQGSLMSAYTRQNGSHAMKQQWARTSTKLYFFNFGNKESSETENNVKEEPANQNKQQEEPDLVEKIFSVFFGKPETSPFGLPRFNSTRFPEQYPATVDEWADPVNGDSTDVAALRPLLKNTNLESRLLRLTYDANRQGWSAEAFHSAVDRQGAAVVVCKTRLGLVAGGYNPKGWVGYGEARGSIAAFLFRQNSNGKYTKLRKVGGAGLAQLDNPESGPSFGADSLVIPLARDNPKLARSKLGSYYERFADGTNSLFGKDAAVQLQELKVYHGVYAPGEYVPFTDAEPFALY